MFTRKGFEMGRTAVGTFGRFCRRILTGRHGEGEARDTDLHNSAILALC